MASLGHHQVLHLDFFFSAQHGYKTDVRRLNIKAIF